jgi:glycosyl transferase family 2
MHRTSVEVRSLRYTMRYNSAPMTDSRVTVVVVPRERLGWRGMEAFYAAADMPCRVIFVDGGSPGRVRRKTEAAAAEHGFEIVRADRYLTSNEARNIGFARVGEDCEYVAFLDNDTLPNPGWLSALVRCGDETGADVIAPLICEGKPLGETVHCAHGFTGFDDRPDGSRVLIEVNDFHGKKVADVADELYRRECTLTEFHAVMVRAETVRAVGGFDERLLATREQVDFCLRVAEHGGKIVFEPEAVIDFLPGPPFEAHDLPYYMLRWSDEWERRGIEHFTSKWGLKGDERFEWRLKNVGRRRQYELIRPLAMRLSIKGRGAYRVQKALTGPERLLNRIVTRRLDPHRRRQTTA